LLYLGSIWVFMDKTIQVTEELSVSLLRFSLAKRER
jgi:hypothetical protein